MENVGQMHGAFKLILNFGRDYCIQTISASIQRWLVFLHCFELVLRAQSYRSILYIYILC